MLITEFRDSTRLRAPIEHRWSLCRWLDIFEFEDSASRDSLPEPDEVSRQLKSVWSEIRVIPWSERELPE